METINCCPQCGCTNFSERMEQETFQYGNDDVPPPGGVVQLTVTVPVMKCGDCAFEWTDYRGEDIRDQAVQDHLREIRKDKS